MSAHIVAQPRIAPDDRVMSLMLTSVGPAKRIIVRGEIDMSNAHLLVELAELAVDRRPSRLVLDLSEVVFLSAHGIGALLQAQNTAISANVPMVLDRLSPRVAYVLAVCGALAEFDLLPQADGRCQGGIDEQLDSGRDRSVLLHTRGAAITRTETS